MKKTLSIIWSVLKFVFTKKITWVALSLLGYGLFFYWVGSNFVFRTPILVNIRFQDPIVKRGYQYPTSTPTPPQTSKKGAILPIKQRTEKDIILSQKNGDILLKIYQLESSSGKNDFCRLNGIGYGGFGVMDNGKIACYPSFSKAVERAQYWFSELSKGKTLAESICFWNEGIVKSNCEYYKNFLTL